MIATLCSTLSRPLAPLFTATRRTAAALVLSPVLLGLPLAAQAQVTVKDPWVRATVAGQKATGAFMTLTADSAQSLVEARSPVAGVVEIHEMKMEGGVMRMRAIPSLSLPAGKGVSLAPGGYHVMLMDIKSELKQGQTVPITLVLEGADRQRKSVELQVPVMAVNASAPK